MTSCISAGSTAHLKREAATRPCWPIIWLWVLSIAQYSYRYLLQVNDASTSQLYSSTPPGLSAIKYGIFSLFTLYAALSLLRRPVSLTRTYSALAFITLVAIMALGVVFVSRLALYPGALDETVTCAVQLMPWMASAVLVPLVFSEKHSLSSTFTTFERVAFWIAFPFWMITVGLAAWGIRYPALSYPGLLVRFGGILDDPNGYACLCLFFLVLAVSFRNGNWRSRTIVYGVMLLGTLSLAGYITALMIVVVWLLAWLVGSRRAFRSRVSSVAIASTVVISAIAISLVGWEKSEDVTDAITALYSAKSNSTTAHVSDLLPDEAMLDVTFPVTLLFGVGGFSENFYWRVLTNFGWLGFFVVVGLLGSWSYCALARVRSWQRNVGAWSVGVLIGSNGIAYLLTFPLNLIYWSILGLLVWTRESSSSAVAGRGLT